MGSAAGGKALTAFGSSLTTILPTQATSIRSVKSLVPLLDRVLVQRVKAEAKTASGIFLPESSVKELNEAKVLAVGPGALDKEGKRLPVGVQAGDRVLIPTVRMTHRQAPRRKIADSCLFECGLISVLLTWVVSSVRRLPCQGWRGRVHPVQGQRVSSPLLALSCCTEPGNANVLRAGSWPRSTSKKAGTIPMEFDDHITTF